MTKISLAFLGIAIAALFFFYHTFLTKERGVNTYKSSLSISKSPKEISKSSQIIFVPYWSIGKELLEVNQYDEIIYFGITPSKEGIDRNDLGYKRLANFLQLSDQDKRQILAVRMTNSDMNSLILEDSAWQMRIIKDSVLIARENGFDGIVLDFEISALSFPSVIKKITEFHRSFFEYAKKNGLAFSVAVYGDTFYRGRPYDIAIISKYSDSIFILAYDFHKAHGDPGPNFPLSAEKDGYDLSHMVDDFSKVVDREKLVIVFGMFGYDWKTDEKGNSTETALPLSFFAIKQKFLDNCTFQNCIIKRDNLSSETQVSYVDSGENKHVVWFEDEESVKKKRELLETKGIQSIGFWAYSYF